MGATHWVAPTATFTRPHIKVTEWERAPPIR